MRKRKERSKEKNKEQKKDIKRSEEYILYNNLEKLGYYIISVGQTRPRQTATNKFF
jgi:hypothetical protein